jgi:hypothetical protein
MSRRSLLLALALGLTLAACGSTASPSPSASAAGAASPNAAPSAVTPSTAASPSKAPTAPPSPAVAAVCNSRDLKFDAARIDLTGPWSGDDDGIYYLRQVGRTLWWSGMSNRQGPPSGLGRDWNNVATGQIKADLTIELNWADVPRGQVMGHGTLVWKVVDDGTGNAQLKKLSETGTGFGGSKFTPCSPG